MFGWRFWSANHLGLNNPSQLSLGLCFSDLHSYCPHRPITVPFNRLMVVFFRLLWIWHKWQEWQLIYKPLPFALAYDFPFPLSFLSFLSHTHLKRSQILSLVFRHRLCLNTFMGILVIHWIAPKRQLIVVNSVRDWSVFLSMYIYVWQGGGSCPPVGVKQTEKHLRALTVSHLHVNWL